MRPHAGTIPLGQAPGTRARRERIEVSIIVPFYDEASLHPHCLERLQRIGEQLAVPCEFLFVDDGSRHDGRAGPGARDAVAISDAALQDPPERMPRVPPDIPTDAGDFRLLGRKAVDALQRLPERNRCMKSLLPGSAWRPG